MIPANRPQEIANPATDSTDGGLDHAIFRTARLANAIIFVVGVLVMLFYILAGDDLLIGVLIGVSTILGCGLLAGLGCIYDRLGRPAASIGASFSGAPSEDT